MEHYELDQITFNFDQKTVDMEKLTNRRTFALSDAMLNAKEFDKMKTDYKKVKELLVDMSIKIKEIDNTIKQDLVTEDKFRVTNELMEEQVTEDIKATSVRVKDILIP